MHLFKIRYLECKVGFPSKPIGDVFLTAESIGSARLKAIRMAAEYCLPGANRFQVLRGMTVILEDTLL